MNVVYAEKRLSRVAKRKIKQSQVDHFICGQNAPTPVGTFCRIWAHMFLFSVNTSLTSQSEMLFEDWKEQLLSKMLDAINNSEQF